MASYQGNPIRYPARAAYPSGYGSRSAPGSARRAAISDASNRPGNEIYELRQQPRRPSTNKFAPDYGVGAATKISPPPSYSLSDAVSKKRFDDKKRDYDRDAEDVETGLSLPEPLPVRSTLCGLNPRNLCIGVCVAVAVAVAIGVGYAVTHRKGGHGNKTATPNPATNGTATPTSSAAPSNTGVATPAPGQLLDGTYHVFGALSAAPCSGGATGLSCASSVSEYWSFSHNGNTYNVAPEGLKNVTATVNNGGLSFQYGSGSHSGSGCVIMSVDTADFKLLGNSLNGTLKSVNTLTTACQAGPVNAFCECHYDITGA